MLSGKTGSSKVDWIDIHFTAVFLLGQSPVCHCGVFRWSEKWSFGKQINHLLCRWVSIASAFRKKPPVV